MCDYFNMVCGFISYVQFLVFSLSYYIFLVLARINVSVSQDAYFQMASMHVQLDSQCVQLARIDVSVGEDAYSVGQHACSVGQDTCFYCTYTSGFL